MISTSADGALLFFDAFAPTPARLCQVLAREQLSSGGPLARRVRRSTPQRRARERDVDGALLEREGRLFAGVDRTKNPLALVR